MKEKTTYENPFLQADEGVKEAIREAVQNLLKEKGLSTYDIVNNNHLWKALDIGIGVSSFYRCIRIPKSPKDEPSRRTYVKVCKRLGIKVDTGRHPLTLA